MQLSFAVQGVLGRLAAEHDLSLTSFRLLAILRDHEPGMLELAGHLGLSKSTVSGLIDRAERRGLVARSAAETDGRGVLVSLTADGRALATQVEVVAYAQLDALLAPLSASKRTQLARLAEQVIS